VDARQARWWLVATARLPGLEAFVGPAVEVSEPFTAPQLTGGDRGIDADLSKGSADTAGCVLRRCDRGVENHGEFIAADAGTELPLANDLCESGADLSKQAVTRIMAKRVVDHLEVIKVDENE
jgi:hypothetical protein